MGQSSSSISLGFPAIPYALAFVWLSLAAGRRALKTLVRDLAGTTIAERGTVSFVLGGAIAQWLALALGTVGRFTPSGLRLGLAAGAVLLIPDCIGVAARVPALVRELAQEPRWVWAVVAACSPVVLANALVALAPTLDADGLAYHLMAPEQWLHTGSLIYLPTYPPTHSPMGLELLYAYALVFSDDSAAKLIHLAFGFVAAHGLYLAGTRLNSRVAGALAAVALWASPTGAGPLLGTAYVEGATACAMVASLLAWLIWWRGASATWLRVGAILAGVAISFKLPALLFAAGFALITFIALAERRESALLSAVTSTLSCGLWTLLPVVPWLVRSQVVTGNPLFPLFARWIPTRDFSASLSAKYDEYNRYYTWASAMGPQLSRELRLSILVTAAGVVALAGGLIAYRSANTLRRRTAIAVTAVVLVQLSSAGLYIRYWIPIISVLSVLVLALFEPWAERLLGIRWARIVGLLGVLILASLSARKAVGFIDGDVSGALVAAVKADVRPTFVARHIPLTPLFEFASTKLPPGSRVLLAGTCMGYYVKVPTYCAEFPTDAIRFAGAASFEADLRRLGVTHIMAPLALANGGPRPPDVLSSSSMIHRKDEFDRIAEILSAKGRILIAASDQGLYDITPSTGAP